LTRPDIFARSTHKWARDGPKTRNIKAGPISTEVMVITIRHSSINYHICKNINAVQYNVNINIKIIIHRFNFLATNTKFLHSSTFYPHSLFALQMC
jgi:hypothetical protein